MISPDQNGISPENSKQRSDYTGNFIEDIDNSEELAAIEKDPTIFPNSTRIYAAGEIHPSIQVPMREIRLSASTRAAVSRKTLRFASMIAQAHGEIPHLKAT